jgi:glycosyltransferase involved in cell wall biosynthesis
VRLLIVSNMAHYLGKRQEVWGWGPTVEEIDYLASRFSSVRHVACLHPGLPPPNALPYRSGGVELIPVAPRGGPRVRDKLGILRELPTYQATILREAASADLIHVRCPANISLISVMLLGLMRRPRYRWAKYAGNWMPEGREAWSSTLQRWWLAHGLHRGIVTVNGQWPDQPGHCYSFFNPCLREDDLEAAAQVAIRKDLHMPYRFLFVGSLSEHKGVRRLIEIVSGLRSLGLSFELDVIGDGPQRGDMQALAERSGVTKHITFHGWRPKSELKDFYGPAHFILHPSSSEGWAKVLSEAMSYGVVPIASAVSSIPQVLEETGAGVAVPVTDIAGFVKATVAYIEQPEAWRRASRAGVTAAQQFTYEHYLRALEEVFQDAWDISLAGSEDASGSERGGS